jgi:exodeoxyribonuclease VII large subunit
VAIGHDRDVPLAQLAADIMVSTPTAAAHAVSATWNRLLENLPALEQGLLYNYEAGLMRQKSRLESLSVAVSGFAERIGASYRRIVRTLILRADQYLAWIRAQRSHVAQSSSLLSGALAAHLSGIGAVVASSERVITSSNPLRNLALGFSIVRAEDGAVVRSVKNVSVGDSLSVEVADGQLRAEVSGGQSKNRST